jgi:hypothetical protein
MKRLFSGKTVERVLRRRKSRGPYRGGMVCQEAIQTSRVIAIDATLRAAARFRRAHSTDVVVINDDESDTRR